jgi:hypothetical protein
MNCELSNNTGPASVLAVDGGIAQLEKCTLATGPRVQAEARSGGIVHFEGCDITGGGLQAVGGSLQIVEGKVQGSEIAIMISKDASCRATGAEFVECQTGAVYAEAGATAGFENCVFDGKGEVAIQVRGASVSLNGCKIVGHTHATYSDQEGKLTFSSTTFEATGKKTPCRAQ